MKKMMLFIAVIMCIVLPVSVMAASNADINTAIVNGLKNLASTQQGDGYWNYGGYEQAATGAVVGAFMSQQAFWGTNAGAYQTTVNNAMSYLLSTASKNTVTTNYDGVNICGGGSCPGVYWYGAGESTYTTGIVASAIGQYAATIPNAVATTSGPLANMTWKQIAQGIVNEYASSQSNSGSVRGGWRYYAYQGDNDADGSTTQWAVLSMIYGQSLGATVPQVVKDQLKNYWLANSAQAANGGGQYQPGGIIDHSDTGSVLISHAFVGDDKTNAQVQAALAFLNTNWKDTANSWYGNFGQPYAMWAVYKGLELQIGLNDNSTITNLLDPSQANWWQDYNQWLVANQNGDGSWNGYSSWYGPLATAWDVSILGGTIIPPPNPGVPEPATLLLLGLGLAGLGAIRRKM